MSKIIVTTIGRLTSDGEVKKTQNGDLFTVFNLAVNKGFGDKEHTLFLNCIVNGNVLEKMKAKKGSSVMITGEFYQRQYVDKDGNNRTAYRVAVHNIEYCPVPKNTPITVTAVGNCCADISSNPANTAGHVNFACSSGKEDNKRTTFVCLNFYNQTLLRVINAKVKKGSGLLVTGDLDIRDFTRTDGTTGTQPVVNVEGWNYCSYPKKEENSDSRSAEQPVPMEQPTPQNSFGEGEFMDVDDEDLPF